MTNSDHSSLHHTVDRLITSCSWLMFGLAGLIGTTAIWLTLPRQRDITTPLEFIAKLVVYALLILAVATFPRHGGRWTWLSVLPLIGFTGYIIPRISYYYYFDRAQEHSGEFYTHLYLLLYPGIVLSIALAMRLGGGAAGCVVKIAATGVLIVFSGFLDVMWQLVNPLDKIADVIDAPHITMITGRPLTFSETIMFTLAHLPLAGLIAWAPMERWLARFDDVGKTPPTSSPDPDNQAPGGSPDGQLPAPSIPSQGETPDAASTAISLSVVAPAYNEAPRIGAVVRGWAHYLATQAGVGEWEIIICDDGSTDETFHILSEAAREIPQLRIIEHASNQGAGAAIASAIAASTQDWVLVTDSDGQFPLDNLDRFLSLISSGCQALSGYRETKSDTMARRFGSKASGLACNLAHSTRYRDFNSIFKLLPGRLARSLPLESRGLSCSTEIMSHIILRGLTWTEVPVVHLQRPSGRSSWRFISGARDRFLFVIYLTGRAWLHALGILRTPTEVAP